MLLNSDIPDNELLLLYKESGDNRYVGLLFTRYTRFVLAVCMKYLKDVDRSKDAVMSIFEKLLLDLSKHDIQNFKSWLHVVAKNYCLMELRKVVYEQNSDDENFVENFMESGQSMHHTDEDDDLEVREQKVSEALHKLKPEQRECIQLFFLEEKTYKEVEQITGLSYKEVKSNLQNGKRNLKNILEGMLILFLWIDIFNNLN